MLNVSNEAITVWLMLITASTIILALTIHKLITIVKHVFIASEVNQSSNKMMIEILQMMDDRLDEEKGNE